MASFGYQPNYSYLVETQDFASYTQQIKTRTPHGFMTGNQRSRHVVTLPWHIKEEQMHNVICYYFTKSSRGTTCRDRNCHFTLIKEYGFDENNKVTPLVSVYKTQNLASLQALGCLNLP